MSDSGGPAVPIPPLNWPLPPPIIPASSLHVERSVGPDGKVVTRYLDILGMECGIQPQQHHQTQAQGHFVPPPS